VVTWLKWAPTSAQPPSIEDLAAAIAAGYPATWVARRRLIRQCRGALLDLVEGREADLGELHRAVMERDWGGHEEVDQVARVLRSPSCTKATHLVLLRGWGRRLIHASPSWAPRRSQRAGLTPMSKLK
jgi:hypothetical protein